MALERQKHSYNGTGINRSPENPPADTLPRLKRMLGIRKAGRIIVTALALQAPLQVLAYDRTFRNDKRTATVASVGIYYRSIEQQIARVPDSPSLATINTSPQPEAPPAAEPKQAESPKCNDGWEALSEGVCFTQFREFGSDIYVVRADLKNPKVSVRPSFVAGPGRLGRLSDGAQRQDAIAAINASFFEGTRALGPIAVDGKWLREDPFPQQVLIVRHDNTAEIKLTRQALREDPAQMKFALSGSHALVRDGITSANFGPDNAGCVLYCAQPRTAIGVNAKGELYMVVADGRSRKSRGMTTPEISGVMDRMGMDEAILLDGGGSTQLYAKGKIYNNPSNGSQKISTLVGVYPRS